MKNCNFCENCIDRLLRDRIVNGIRDDVVRKTLLSEKKLTLEATIEKCRAQEKAIQGMETMRKAKNQDEEEEINAVHFRNNSGEKQQRGINKGKRETTFLDVSFAPEATCLEGISAQRGPKNAEHAGN